MAQIVKTCIDCGIEFTTGSNRAVRCPEHQKEHRTESNRLAKQKSRSKLGYKNLNEPFGSTLFLKGHRLESVKEESSVIISELQWLGLRPKPKGKNAMV